MRRKRKPEGPFELRGSAASDLVERVERAEEGGASLRGAGWKLIGDGT